MTWLLRHTKITNALSAYQTESRRDKLPISLRSTSKIIQRRVMNRPAVWFFLLFRTPILAINQTGYRRRIAAPPIRNVNSDDPTRKIQECPARSGWGVARRYSI